MLSSAPPPAAERFTALIRALTHAVVTRGLCGLLAALVTRHIIDRTRDIHQRFQRLSARIARGAYTPRRPFTRRPSANPAPRRPSPVQQKFGWVQALMPEANALRGQLETLLADPEMTALIQAAPAEMGRILRPLCWMLRLHPPPILAPSPRRPRGDAPRRSRTARKNPAPPPPAPIAATPENSAASLVLFHPLGPSYRRNG